MPEGVRCPSYFLFRMNEDRYNFLVKKYREMTRKEITEEIARLKAYKNDPNEEKRDEYSLAKSELEERKVRVERQKKILAKLNSTDKNRIPDFLLEPEITEQIPDKALDYLIQYGYNKNTFEKLVSEEGNSMILLNWIEDTTENDILNMRNEGKKVILSLRLKSGNLVSYDYDDIAAILDETKRVYETRRNLANYYLTMSDEERKIDEERFKESYAKTPEKEKEWLLEVERTEAEIRKLEKLEHLFWQAVEHFNAGIWKKPSTKTFGELINPAMSEMRQLMAANHVISKPNNEKRKSKSKSQMPESSPYPQMTATTEKIPGEFLRIEEETDGYFKIEYVINGVPHWIKVDREDAFLSNEYAIQNVKTLTETLRSAPKESVEEIKSQLDSYRISVLWPQMYIAYRKGEDLGKFFEGAVSLEKQGNMVVPTVEESKKKEWLQTKAKFAEFVRDEYEKHPKQYKNLKDAAEKMYVQHTFPNEEWTFKQCYDFVRKK
jgi:hypothetical protein